MDHNVPNLRGPPGRLVGARHEPAMMVNRFEQGDLEGIAGIENAESARAEAARSSFPRVRHTHLYSFLLSVASVGRALG